MLNNKRFYELVIPSIGVMLISALYIIVDGIFVGRGIGINALAAVNISLPFVTLMIAITMMITMGGATITSIRIGEKNYSGANITFNISLRIIILFSIFLSIISLLFSEEISIFLEATDILVKDTATYLKYYTLFSSFFCGAMILSTFVRNDANPKLSFYGMFIGAISNIFLDWLFIFPLQMGVKGAAIASGLGQILACTILLTHFFKKKGLLRLNFNVHEKGLLRKITVVGMPVFITQTGASITTFCYNIVVMKYFEEIGVSAYSIINYLIVIITAFFLGVSQGIQPLISYNFGRKNFKDELYFFRKGIKVNLFLAVFTNLLIYIFGIKIISLFNSNKELINLTFSSMKIYAISFLFSSINVIFITYYLATKRIKEANFIALLRSFILNSTCILTFPILFGKNAIWFGIVVAEFIVMIISIKFKTKNNWRNFKWKNYLKFMK